MLALADTYLPEPPHCAYGLRVLASCALHVPEAQGSLAPGTTVRTPYTYQPGAPRAERTAYCGTTGAPHAAGALQS